ncbi:glycosyltransferase family 10 domain-containing protein [Chloroflexota bacterium]
MNLSPKDLMVFIDMPEAFYNNELFKATSKRNLNEVFAPFIFLKERLAEKGIIINTADYFLKGILSARINIYVSIENITNYKKLTKLSDVYLQSFYISEPPAVDPLPYYEISHLTKCFDRVYVPNTQGVGYERYFSNQPNLRKFYIPQIKDGIIEQLWSNKNRGFLVMINANKTKYPYLRLSRWHNPSGLHISLNRSPGLKSNELYSERIRAILALKNLGNIDLYGYGWDTSLSQILRNMPSIPLSFPSLYLKNRKAIKAIYKGSVKSKHETLSQYKFNICFENMVMPGWITEKIFDCFFVGTIPIFLGAPDVDRYIPRECFIDMRDFNDYGELYTYLSAMSDEDIQSFREAGREFLSSEQYHPFTKEHFAEQFEIDFMQTLKANGINLTSLQMEV